MTAVAPGDALLSLRDVSVDFPARRGILGRSVSWVSAVNRVSLDVRAGETLAIVGESGSGKSTVARAILRLQRLSAGTISFAGQDVWRAVGDASVELRRRIQIVFQDPYSSLDPRMRLREIVAEGLYHERLTADARARRVAELLESVGLGPNLMANYPHQLSGGQRQRVGIARALAGDPALLVADEPVSALDGSIQGQILNLLRALQRSRGLTMVFITHDLSVARYMADRIAVMQLGRVVEVAPTERLFEAPGHPYTQALLSAIPRFGLGGGRRIVLTGDAPSPIDPPRACRFAGRCFRRIDRCVVEEPELRPDLGPDHSLACFNWALPDLDTGLAGASIRVAT